MKKVFLYNITLILALLAVSASQAQDYRKSKNIERQFEVEDGAELKIENKYGNLQFMHWDKNEISIEIKIEVRAKKESKAIDLLNDIDVEFTEFKGYVEAITKFGSEGSFWGQMKTKTSDVFTDGNKTQIDYKIYLPENIQLDIKNKYGDLLLEDHIADVTIDLSNGDFRGGTLMGKNDLVMEFAFARIEHLENAKIKLDHKAELEVNTAKSIILESRSSRFRIREAESVDLVSHRDKVRLEKVGLVKIESSYSYIEVDELSADLGITGKYGSLNIGEIHEDVSDLNFSVENTNINFTLPEDRFLAIESVYNESAGLFFPSPLRNKVTVKENEEEKLVMTTGDIGKRSGKILHLKVRIIDGNLNVK